ncbi:MAG: glycosyltransferase family A protein [Rhodospirillaceae bacterium]
MTARVDVLIPTLARPAALAITLTALAAQTHRDFRVVISDQSDDAGTLRAPELQTPLRLLRALGYEIEIHRHLPRRGMAEQRQFLLDRASASYALFLDDDIILERDGIERMQRAIEEEHCGFVGCAAHGLSYVHEERPHQQHIEFWEGPVEPEHIEPGGPAWPRHHLHSAANLFHVQRRLGITADRQRKYRVAWVGACVLYDTRKLRAAGGYDFWAALPQEHCGEDVLAQLRVMARYGGCGLIPSPAYHQELPTTVHDRRVDAPFALRHLHESFAPRSLRCPLLAAHERTPA